MQGRNHEQTISGSFATGSWFLEWALFPILQTLELHSANWVPSDKQIYTGYMQLTFHSWALSVYVWLVLCIKYKLCADSNLIFLIFVMIILIWDFNAAFFILKIWIAGMIMGERHNFLSWVVLLLGMDKCSYSIPPKTPKVLDPLKIFVTGDSKMSTAFWKV